MQVLSLRKDAVRSVAQTFIALSKKSALQFLWDVEISGHGDCSTRVSKKHAIARVRGQADQVTQELAAQRVGHL